MVCFDCRQLQQPLLQTCTKTSMFCAYFVHILCIFFKNVYICAYFSQHAIDSTIIFFKTQRIILQTLTSSTPLLTAHHSPKNRGFSTKYAHLKSCRTRNINLYSIHLQQYQIGPAGHGLRRRDDSIRSTSRTAVLSFRSFQDGIIMQAIFE